MTRPSSGYALDLDLATRADLDDILGDPDDRLAGAILELRPTIDEVEQALLWANGDLELLGPADGTPAGTVAQIFDILTENDQDGLPTLH
jgi:hypothetical protein